MIPLGQESSKVSARAFLLHGVTIDGTFDNICLRESRQDTADRE